MDSIRMTSFYQFIGKYLLIAVEYLVLQGHFTVKVDKNLIKWSKVFVAREWFLGN